MLMSVDGFIAGPNDGPGNGLGDGGQPLARVVPDERRRQSQGGRAGRLETACTAKIMDQVMSTGGGGRRPTDLQLADGWGGDHHDGVPIFVLSRHQPRPWHAGLR